MFEKEAEEIANKKLCSERICYNHCNFNSPKHHRCGEWHRIYECAKESAEFGYNKANEQLTLPKDILGLWEQTVCEIRSEIKSWDLKGPHVSDYAKELCDKLEHSMCAVAGGPYSLRYSITD